MTILCPRVRYEFTAPHITTIIVTGLSEILKLIGGPHTGTWSRGSAVRVAITPRAGRPRFRILAEPRDFLFSETSRPSLGSTRPTVKSVLGPLPGVRRQGREVFYIPLSAVEVKNEWSCTSAPPICLHTMYTVGLTFVHVRAKQHGQQTGDITKGGCTLFTVDESLKVNCVNSLFIKIDHPRWRMQEVGRSQLSFTLDESSWMNHQKWPMETCQCVFLRSDQRVFLLFAVWLLILLNLKHQLWLSNGNTFFFSFLFQ
jgi:hypothetical protein